MKNESPDETEDEFEFAIDDVRRVDVDDFDVFHFLQKLQRHRHVLQLLRPEVGPLVVLGKLLVGQYLLVCW